MESTALEGLTVVVIDDQVDLCTMLCEMLRLAGATAIGLCLVDPRSVILRGVDLVIVDVMLAGHYDGVEFAGVLRDRGYSAPLIAISASAGMLAHARKSAVQFVDYLAKPLDLDDLYAAVRQATGRLPGDTTR